MIPLGVVRQSHKLLKKYNERYTFVLEFRIASTSMREFEIFGFCRINLYGGSF